MPQRLGIHTRPEEREITDMTMDVTFGLAHACFGFGKHCRHLRQRLSRKTADAVDRVTTRESDEQIRDVVDQQRIGDTQLSLKRLLRYSSKKSAQRVTRFCFHIALLRKSVSRTQPWG